MMRQNGSEKSKLRVESGARMQSYAVDLNVCEAAERWGWDYLNRRRMPCVLDVGSDWNLGGGDDCARARAWWRCVEHQAPCNFAAAEQLSP